MKWKVFIYAIFVCFISLWAFVRQDFAAAGGTRVFLHHPGRVADAEAAELDDESPSALRWSPRRRGRGGCPNRLSAPERFAPGGLPPTGHKQARENSRPTSIPYSIHTTKQYSRCNSKLTTGTLLEKNPETPEPQKSPLKRRTAWGSGGRISKFCGFGQLRDILELLAPLARPLQNWAIKTWNSSLWAHIRLTRRHQ